jgi:CTP:molybdopterin cytidylyltransferase MocA
MVTAIILASGKGTRFGKPKAEADYKGVSFLDRITATLKEAGVQKIHVAQDYETPDMLATLKQAVTELEKGWIPASAGKTSSPESQSYSCYLIFPVDFPFVQAETIKTIVAAHYKHPKAIIRPCYYGFCGHPIIIPADLDLQADDHGKGLKGIISFCGKPVIDIQVHDEGIHKNINFQKDLP